MKAPSAASQQWGSYFVDVHKGGGSEEDSPKLTWCCHSIHKYSTMAIPSVEHIAGTGRERKHCVGDVKAQIPALRCMCYLLASR